MRLENQNELFHHNQIDVEFVEYLVERGFVGECSVVSQYMKTSSNIFNASCIFHDVGYTIGGNEADRRRADSGFYRRCMQNAAALKKVREIWYFSIIATVWYMAVRAFGWTAFQYGEYRSVEEILELNIYTKTHTKWQRFIIKSKSILANFKTWIKR